jgi:hypothetical protein
LEHLDRCADCQAVAEGERSLALVFSNCQPAVDLEKPVLATVARRRLRLRLWNAVPVFASLAVLLAGAGLLGGMPGGSLFSQVPYWSADGWSVLVEMAGSWFLVLSAFARATSTQLATLTSSILAVVALTGTVSVVVLARRWVRRRVWQRDV